jgi:cytochrome c biogenesis protein CcmG/thiol:disulfide interchange protein DsbE
MGKEQHMKRSRVVVTVVVIAAVAVIAVVAALSTGGEGTTTADVRQTQPVTITGTTLPVFPDNGVDPAIGLPAPEISGYSFDGTPVSITADGKPKIIAILAHWCSHCQNDVDMLTSYIKDNGMPPLVDLYAISTGADASYPNYPPSKWLKDWPVPTIADSSTLQAAAALGVNAFPFFVFISADGNVDFRFPGEVQPDVLYQAAIALANG